MELSLRANKKKSDRYCEVPVLHMEIVSWVGHVQVFMRAEYIFPISLAFSRNLIFFPSGQRGEFQMGMFLLIGKKKDCFSFIFLVFRRAYISKQKCSK